MKLIRTAKEVCVHYYKIYPSFEKDLCSDWMAHHAEIHNLKNNIKKRDEVDKLEMENNSLDIHPETMHHVDNIRIAQLAEQHAEIEKLKAQLEAAEKVIDTSFYVIDNNLPFGDHRGGDAYADAYNAFEKLKAGAAND